MHRHNTGIGLNSSGSNVSNNTYTDKLAVIETDCKNLQQKLNEVAEVCAEIASEISTQLPSGFKSLQNSVAKLAEVDNSCSEINSALSYLFNEVIQKRSESTKNLDLCDVYTKKITELRNTNMSNRTPHRFVSRLTNSNNPEPNRTNELGDDEDLMVGQVQISTICPLTQKELKSPVKNPRCGHVYSKSAIHAHIRTKGAAAECPSSGCVKVVVQSELLTDRDMELMIKRKNRAKMMTGEDSSNSEDDADDNAQLLIYKS